MTSSRPLEGKTAIVTGARRGIGRAEAVALAIAGAHIVACDLDGDMADLKREIGAVDVDCLTLRCDVTIREDTERAVARTVETFGGVDILVNNAQAGLEPIAWENLTDDLVEMSLSSGPVASWRFMQACFPYMKAQGWGRIINTASGAAKGGVSNLGHYAMAKGAIASLTYAAATDWSRYGITVNVIYPAILTEPMQAWIDSDPAHQKALEDQIPVGFLGDAARDLGPVIVFLASEGARYITGHPFFVDGGAGKGPS